MWRLICCYYYDWINFHCCNIWKISPFPLSLENFQQVQPRKIVISEQTPWKPILITGVVPIKCRGRSLACSIVANIRSHDDYVTDKCQMRISEISRRRFILNVRAVKDFKKSGKKSMILKFDAIRSRPGGSRFWVGYKIPSVKVTV
jgi:hypothetical protein